MWLEMRRHLAICENGFLSAHLGLDYFSLK